MWLMRLKDGRKTELATWDDGIRAIAWSRDEQRIIFSSVEGYGALWEVAIRDPGHVERGPLARGSVRNSKCMEGSLGWRAGSEDR